MKTSQKMIKQCIGIDISMSTFDVAIIALMEDFVISKIATKKFENNQQGFELFYKWLKEFIHPEIQLNFTMEATGVYYEHLAYFLFSKDEIVNVVLPNIAKKFSDSLGHRIKTDKADAQMLGRMGVEPQLRRWLPASPKFLKLRSFTRERESVISDRSRAKNQLHALKFSRTPDKKTIARLKEKIEFLDEQISEIELDIDEFIKQDETLASKVKKVLTVPGIRINTLAIIIAETNGFAAISNMKQLTSYAGYDPQIRESGKWSGRSKISKKGNSHIRGALFFPACTAARYNEHLKKCSLRIKESKKIPMIANTAIQRKLLSLIYTLWKNNTEFDNAYEQNKQQRQTPAA